MIKKSLLLAACLMSIAMFTGQKSDDDPRWSSPRTTLNLSGEYVDLPVIQNDIKQFTFFPRINKTPNGVLTTFPNVRVLPSTVTQQTELPIVRNPNNPNWLFASSNSARTSGGSFINSASYFSSDGGQTWRGSDSINAPNFNDQRGDPGPTIDKNNRIIFTHLTSSTNFGSVTGMGANYSTDNGLTWSATFQVVSDANADKNLAGTDDSPTSPFYGNSYFAWTSFGTNPANGRASVTTNGGVSWSVPVVINATPSGHNAQGHDVAVDPDGNVFVVWTAGISSSPFTEDFVGVAKSTNGGISYVATENAFDVNGSRSTSFNGWTIRTNGFPRIAIDKTGGPRRGWIYVVTSQLNLAPAGSDADVILRRSSDQGATWSAGIRVNQDALNNGKVQFFPAVCVDDAGGVNIVYYDNRNFPSVGDSCSVFISRSVDGGSTFTDVEVADHHFKPKPATGFSGGYMGDYIGITSSTGKVVAIWMDDKAGVAGFYNAWTGALQTITYPLNAFNLQTPSPGTSISSFPNSTTQYSFTWDTSASTASYKWIFGSPNATARQITLPGSGNLLTVTAGQLDNILAGLGVAQGDSLVGEWDVWAFANNQSNDSLKAANGPRALTLKRGVPPLIAFNLNTPPNGTTITTSGFNNSTINMNWNRSGQGVTYKWKFGNPSISNVVLSMTSNNSGFDSALTLVNSALDLTLAGIGLNPGDSLVGEYAVWAYNATDSLKSTQTYALTLKRQAKGDVIVCYDSTLAACRTSRDSITNNLSQLGVTYDLFNKGTNTATTGISFRGYKKVIIVGEGTSVMSNRTKDSLKSYIAAGGNTVGTKSKVIIFSEDVGYHLDRSGSTYRDTTFARGTLGFEYVADRPGTLGTRGLIGVTTNPGVADSTAGPWPDVLKKAAVTPAPESYRLYKFRLYPDSTNGIGRLSSNFNVAVMAVDIESLRPTPDSPPGSPVRRFLKGALDFVDELLLPNLQLTNLIEGFYNPGSNLMVPDTLRVYLRNTSSPFAVVDSSKALMNSSGSGSFTFKSAVNGPGYYLQLIHRNAVETWSATGVVFNLGQASYDFTTDSTKAFGNNMPLAGTRWVNYGGDPTRDGIVDLSDITAVYNNTQIFAEGYLATDVNGDNVVDLSDLILTHNNAFLLVTKIVP